MLPLPIFKLYYHCITVLSLPTPCPFHPFKITDDKTPIISTIEQNNFTNESLHVIGQQLDRIEEKIVEKTSVSKTEIPLIDLPSQDKK